MKDLFWKDQRVCWVNFQMLLWTYWYIHTHAHIQLCTHKSEHSHEDLLKRWWPGLELAGATSCGAFQSTNRRSFPSTPPCSSFVLHMSLMYLHQCFCRDLKQAICLHQIHREGKTNVMSFKRGVSNFFFFFFFPPSRQTITDFQNLAK